MSGAPKIAICRIGSGTPGGNLRRSYWQPIARSEEMPIGGEAPGLLRDAAQNQFPEFISTADFIEDGEDGPASIRRILGDFPAAAE